MTGGTTYFRVRRRDVLRPTGPGRPRGPAVHRRPAGRRCRAPALPRSGTARALTPKAPPMTDVMTAVRSCLRSNNAWRQQATALRAHAELTHLNESQRARLQWEAAAADRQADMWLTGAIEAS